MNFYQNVYKIVNKIPQGKVMTYGQIAGIISTPKAARVVGYALRALPPDTVIPWQRVINSHGLITISNKYLTKNIQAKLLKQEGIAVNKINDNWQINLKKYLWLPK